jgi:hypothetical protein
MNHLNDFKIGTIHDSNQKDDFFYEILPANKNAGSPHVILKKSLKQFAHVKKQIENIIGRYSNRFFFKS